MTRQERIKKEFETWARANHPSRDYFTPEMDLTKSLSMAWEIWKASRENTLSNLIGVYQELGDFTHAEFIAEVFK